ncbi:hypothetical protein SAMN05216360_11636 [Methylobacterium phyllostachyos]|uniref:Uncharacterized protein n=1 Tax=Methylobacterium phyllostachyos TaxID=582672 RepID=A0A1H0HIT0_9HYPH|nr:hypothetical protein [Methylobacterium phyllostachyos]SDO19010.1 hypothetical protein SAMN05216360_11636 [Methylobacterium phyllostachyos]
MFTVRYSALFEPSKINTYFIELALSMATLKYFIGPYVDLKVVIYIQQRYRPKFEAFAASYGFNYKLVALDDGPIFHHDKEFAQTIVNCEDVDRICIRRMLADFRELDVQSHRLLIGADVFFFAAPDEILRFYWSSGNKNRVLYAADTLSFRGSLYKLKFFRAPIIEGLLGDFYMLAPGVSLTEKSIKQCLRLIDSWPVSECQFVPEVSCRSNLSEQHAAAILLEPFGGELLPPERYNHSQYGPDSVATHWHAANLVAQRMPEAVMRIFGEALHTIM